MPVETINNNGFPLVSVCVVTYNQENTITQTLQSILMQKGSFNLEIVVGDDCSKDKTSEICLYFQEKYPEIVRLNLKNENQGVVRNFIDVLRLCKGQYIGICAGDDYWVDDYKIEKQLSFFTKNPGFGVVSTAGYKLLVKKNKLIEGIAPINPDPDGWVFDKTWRGGVYAMPLSLLIQAELFNKIDFDEFVKRDFSVEDVPMQAILAKHTRFGHIPDLCVVYRVYNSSQSFVNFNHPRYLKYHKGLVEIRRYLNELFPGDVEFSEEWAHNYMVYRRFLVAVYNFNYSVARKELESLLNPGDKERKAIIWTRTIIGFMIFAIVKRFKLMKSEII